MRCARRRCPAVAQRANRRCSSALSGGAARAGIGPRTYRTYPVRSGENIEDIISKRGISRAEVNALNPEVNLDKLQGGAAPAWQPAAQTVHHVICVHRPQWPEWMKSGFLARAHRRTGTGSTRRSSKWPRATTLCLLS